MFSANGSALTVQRQYYVGDSGDPTSALFRHAMETTLVQAYRRVNETIVSVKSLAYKGQAALASERLV